MYDNDSSVGLMDRPAEGGFSLRVSDVTGSHTVVASDVSPEMSAGVLAQALADRMALPSNVPWTLRDDRSAAFLDEGRPIGDQIENEATVTITPKTHLG